MDDTTTPAAPEDPSQEPTEVMPVAGEPVAEEETLEDDAAREAPADEIPGDEEPPDEDANKKRLWIWIAVAVVAAILLGWWALSGSPAEEPEPEEVEQTETISVPALVGLDEAAAKQALVDAGLSLGTVEDAESIEELPGTVLEQNPGAGTEVEADSMVSVVVAIVPVVAVPDVSGLSESGAIAKLAEAGLPVRDTVYEFDPAIAAGFVISQDPPADEEVEVGTIIGLVVSKGISAGQIPNVVGLAQADANGALVADGFTVRVVSQTNADVAAGVVSAQSPAAGIAAPTGSAVTITVSTGAPATPTVVVPDVMGMQVVEAVTTLNTALLGVDFEFAPTEDAEEYLQVAAQNPAAGVSAQPGATVVITIGLPAYMFDGSLSDVLEDFVTLPSVETTE